jgi:hypothetical protein
MKKIIVIVLTTIFGSSINAQIIPFGFKKPTVLIAGQSYGGGKVAYILVPGDPGYSAGETHGLIAATSDQSTGIMWSAFMITRTGATGTAIGTGVSNTNMIIASQGNFNYAAKICAEYSVTVDGVVYDDWYLPSKDELNKLYLNKVAIGGFAGDYYWSSTEVNLFDELGWGQNFNSGSQFMIAKEGLSYVRAIRAF